MVTERRMKNVSLEVRTCATNLEEIYRMTHHAGHVWHVDTGRVDRYHWCPGYHPMPKLDGPKSWRCFQCETLNEDIPEATFCWKCRSPRPEATSD